MTDVDLIEDRLRRAFRAVAEEPITSIGRDIESQWSGGSPSSRRRLGLLVGAVAVVIVIGFGLALAYGPGSSGPVGSHTSPATRPLPAGPAEFRVVFAPGSPATPTVLQQAASILTNRLRGLGAGDIRASVVGNDIDVSGKAAEGAVGRDLRVAGATEAVSLRPVECGTLAYSPAVDLAAPATSTPLPACAARYETNEANLAVTPDSRITVGYTDRKVPPDPAFTSYPSTLPSVADFDSSRTVLLPTAPGVGDLGYARYVLGPSELNGTDIAGARVVKVGGQWAVDITFTPAATVKWDAFVDANFHQMISIDLDGAVLSAPLIQPKQTSFSSLEGKFQLSGTFSAGQARRLASVFGKDPMPIALVRQSQRIVGPGLAH